ncbi:Imm53 family immunity protein [Sorangium sp. So ce1099]|uniref:Imm53 family immunity protein n=1 Tax=Sorangium sp. So ce1099 TaxID=3133331 RepID=UPI003F615B2F
MGLEETAYISQDLTIRDGRYLTKHVYAGETQLASKMDSAWLNHPPTLYFHTDHLRSTQYTSNEEQTLIQHNEYFPSGELWQDETDSRYEQARRYVFSGKELDVGTGLYYFGARFYDGRQSQWVSPDPMVAQYFGGGPALGVYAPRNLSLYAYAGNNPVNYVDHNGEYFESVWDGISLGLGIASLVDNVAQGQWGSAAIDAGGVALDTFAMALPVVPGGAGAAIQGARAADKLNDMRKAADQGADAAKAVDQAADAAKAVAQHGDEVADVAGNAVKGGAMAGRRLGHTFTKHGSPNTAQLLKQAAGSGKPVGQWLDNAAAEQLSQIELVNLDSIIEAGNALDVVTTWHEEPPDACEYFLHAAAGGRAHLLALILSRPELQAMLNFAQELTMERDTLPWLQEWYRSRCDGEWEHQHGIRIETLDNPGWSVVADVGTADAPAPVSEERSDDDWVRCDVKDGRFHGHGGTGNLQEILEILRAWIRTSHG